MTKPIRFLLVAAALLALPSSAFATWSVPRMPFAPGRFSTTKLRPSDSATFSVTSRVVMTNKMPSCLIRGFGGPQIYLALERMVQDRKSVV